MLCLEEERLGDCDERSDEELVAAARSALPGDHSHYEELLRRHQGRVLANCRHITGSPDDAQDLAQEVFVKTYFALPKLEGRSLFRTWLQRIKVNHCLNFLRKNRGRVFVDVDDPAMSSEESLKVAGQGAVDRRFERDRIRAVLDRLPDTLRIPLVLCDVDGFSYREVADRLGIGLSATKMRIKRGRELFRSLYDGDGDESAGASRGDDR